jgi:hypothetical protein
MMIRISQCLRARVNAAVPHFGSLAALAVLALTTPAAADFLTPENQAYRDLKPDSDGCRILEANPAALSGPADNDETKPIAEAWWKCMLQRHVNPPRDASKAHLPARKTINDPSAYNLSFVEFGEEGQPLKAEQKRALFDHLTAQKQNYVVVFVHGWRNDASRGNKNLMNFRTLLSYAKTALESRCREAGRYCDATLTGVFVGWRGQALTEDGEDFFSSAKEAFTMFWRKPASERISGGVVAFLKELSQTLDERSASATTLFERDHMLIMGHSLGGNMLVTGFQDSILRSINARRDLERLKPPAGDLIVLLNPAAEARKWTAFQDAVVAQAKNRFAPTQTPVMLSLTATCHYLEKERVQGSGHHGEILCDKATSEIFPWFQIANFDFLQEGRTAIGQLDPEGDETTRSGHGTTHEFEMNGSLYWPTVYAHASDPNYAQCRIGDGWLKYAKELVDSPYKWDAGHLTGATKVRTDDFAVDPMNDAVFLNVAEADLNTDERPHIRNKDFELRVRGQFMHGVYRHLGPSITGPDDPFWNVRAIDDAVQEHGGIFSPWTWCALHQLVLDDVAGAPLYARDRLWPPRTLPGDGLQEAKSP